MRRFETCVRSLAALGVVLSIAAGPGAAADTALVVGKAAATADPIIPVNVGDELGIFKKYGLDLKIVDFAGGSKMAQAMAAGSIDIGDGAGTEMALVAKGVPMLAVCESASSFPFLAVGVPADSPIRSLADLKDKKIGISSPGSLTDWLTKELARKEGWGPAGVTAVALGNGSAGVIAAFKDHLVDADIGGTSLFLDMEDKKAGRVLTPVSSFEGPVASGTLYASNRLIDTDKDVIRAFLAGWLETMDFIRAHKAETVKIESKVTGFSESVMAKEYDLVQSMYTRDCKFDTESLSALKRSFVDLKLMDRPPENMSTLYTEAFLPK